MFDLAKIITNAVSEELYRSKDIIKYISFNTAIITNSSFEIMFSNIDKEILIKLGIHPLDIPWSLDISIISKIDNIKISLNDWKKNKHNLIENVYEVNLDILNIIGDKTNELAEEIASDLIMFLKEESV